MYVSLSNDSYWYAHIQIFCNYQANQRYECNCIHFNNIYLFIINTRFLQETLYHKSHFVPHNLCFTIRFCTNTHLYLTSITSLSVWTTGPIISYFTHEFSSIWIPLWPIISTSTFFDDLWLKFSIITSGNIKSNFKWKYVVDNNFIPIPYFSYTYIMYWNLVISRYLFLFKR